MLFPAQAAFNNDPVNSIDPLGLSTVRIETTTGKVTLVDPTGSQVREAISKLPDGSITGFEVTGHGWYDVMIIGAGESGDNIYLDQNDLTKKIRYSDEDINFSDSIRKKLDPSAKITLEGCQTANSHHGINIAQQLSKELPGVEVSGNKGYGIGNEYGLPWNRDKFIRLGKENLAIGIKRAYLNGKEK